jgi:hypothetical protein
MADHAIAVAIGVSIQASIVFPMVIIPIYSTPRAFLIHSYCLIGLLRGTATRPSPAKAAEVAAAA